MVPFNSAIRPFIWRKTPELTNKTRKRVYIAEQKTLFK